MSTYKKKEKDLVMKEHIDESIYELADLVYEGLEEDGCHSNEAFEQYSHLLKTKILSDSEHFRVRFAKGYQAMLDEIQKQ